MVKRFVAQDNDVCQPLRIYGTQRFIINDNPDWQFLFNSLSIFQKPIRVLKIAGEYDASTLNDMKLVSYLYISNSGATSKAESCSFRFYRVINSWTEELITTRAGTELLNGYWFVSMSPSDLGLDLEGSNTLMLEVVVKRLDQTYRDRIYLNAIGIYGNTVKLRNDVDFLDLTKADE